MTTDFAETPEPQSFTQRAREALDALGWANAEDPMEVVQANMQLARLVVDMAGALDRLTAPVLMDGTGID